MKTEVLKKHIVDIAANLGHDGNVVEQDMNTWLSTVARYVDQDLNLLLLEYFAVYITSAKDQLPSTGFALTYAEYANLTSFLPAKGGKETLIKLSRNQEGDLLFSMEGETNITKFGKQNGN